MAHAELIRAVFIGKQIARDQASKRSAPTLSNDLIYRAIPDSSVSPVLSRREATRLNEKSDSNLLNLQNSVQSR